jgi:hypothetical protein
MSIIPIKNPEIIVDGNVLKWSAVHHPITFEVQRKDQGVSVIFMPGANTIIKVIGSVPSGVSIGTRIQFHSSNGNIYDWTISNIQGSNILTNGLISGTQYGGFVIYPDLKLNYHVEADVRYVAGGIQWVLLGTLRTVPDLNGFMKLRVNKWLKSSVTFQNTGNYSQINEAIPGEGTRFTITYKEMFDGSNEAKQTVSGSHYFSNSAKQIQDLHGTNMGDFTPFPNDSRDERAKFLSVFPKPTYFPGYPFSLSFIYSDNLGNKQITREEEEFDINGVSVNTESDNLLISERYYNNRLMIKQSYPSTTKEVDVWLDAGEASTDTDGQLANQKGYSDGTIFEVWIDGPNQPVINPIEETSN